MQNEHAMPDLYTLLLQNIGAITPAAASLFAILALVWLKKHFVTWKAYDARLKTIDHRFADHEARITRQGEQIAAVEGVTSSIADALANLPQREDLQALEISLMELRGNLREINAGMHGLKDLVERQETQTSLLHEHILGMGK